MVRVKPPVVHTAPLRAPLPRPARSAPAGGFTLLELLVVVSILAILVSSAYLIYDPLEAKVLKERTFSEIRTVSDGMRTFQILSGHYPTAFDSLLVADITSQGSTHSIETVAMPQPVEPFVGLPASWHAILGGFMLTPHMVRTLSAAGVTSLRYIGDDLVGANGIGNENPGPEPNTIFSDTQLGRGFLRTLQPGDYVAAMKSGCRGTTLVSSFSGAQAVDSSTISRLTGLDASKCHVVIVVGLGRNSSLIFTPHEQAPVTLSAVPRYPDVPSHSYSNFLLMFHLATSDDAHLTDNEVFPRAIYLGVVRTGQLL